MNHLKVIAAAALAAALIIPATPALADDVIWQEDENGSFGIDCTRELLWSEPVGGQRLYAVALEYEVYEFCGHYPLIIWTAEQSEFGPQPIEFWDALTAPQNPTPPAQPESPAPAPETASDPEHTTEEALAPAPAVKTPTALQRAVKGYGRP